MRTYIPYITKTQNGIGMTLTILLSFLILLSSCSKENVSAPDGNGQCPATIRMDVGMFAGDGSLGTRSVSGNDDENRIENIWVFQYNAETGASLHVPVYLDNFDSNDIDVTLTLNESGARSLVCIVANVGEFTDSGGSDKWALDENNNVKSGFDTYDGLLQQAIPEKVSKPFTSSNMGATDGKTIPMFGVSKALAIVSKSYVLVPLVRMFARLRISVDPSYYHENGMEIKSISFSGIPSYCRVSSLSPDDNTQAATYPDTVTWEDFNAGDADDVTLYLPENLQGVVTGMTGKQETDDAKIPEHALRIELVMSYGESQTHTYTIYPGSDMENDFNIKRNHIFNVDVRITKLPE